MKKFFRVTLLALAAFFSGVFLAIATSDTAFAGTGFLKGEYVSGMNRICIYDDLGSDVYYTISATELCPLTINT